MGLSLHRPIPGRVTVADRNPAVWPSFWLAVFRPREYELQMQEANAVSRQWADNQRIRINRRVAVAQIERLRHELSPERRLELQQALATWEAHLDSLEDDGVYAIPKGHE